MFVLWYVNLSIFIYVLFCWSFTYKTDSLTLFSILSDIKGVERGSHPPVLPALYCVWRISSVFSAFGAVVPLVILQPR